MEGVQLTGILGRMAKAGIIKPEASLDAQTPVGRFEQIVGQPIWDSPSGPCVEIRSEQGEPIYVTSGHLPQVSGQRLFSVASKYGWGTIGYAEAEVETGKAVLDAVCGVGGFLSRQDKTIDILRGARVTLYAQTASQNDAFLLAQGVPPFLRSIFGTSFACTTADAAGYKVHGLPGGAGVALAFEFDTGEKISGRSRSYLLAGDQIERFGRSLDIRQLDNNLFGVRNIEPRVADQENRLMAPGIEFKDGTVAVGQKMAERAFANALELLDGRARRPKRIVRLTVHIRSAPDFINQPRIIDRILNAAAAKYRSGLPAWVVLGMTDEQMKMDPSLLLDIMYETEEKG